jgi:hypothetical protein
VEPAGGRRWGAIGGRATFIEKLVSVLLTAAFLYFLVPALKSGLSYFGTVVVVGVIFVISWSMGRFLAGDHEWPVLVPAALAVTAMALLFTFGGFH